jgi:hypothetical protein
MPDRRQGSFLGLDAVAGEGASLALAAIEKPVVGSDVQIGGGGLLLEIGRACFGELHLL